MQNLNEKVTASDVVIEKDKTTKEQKYNDYVKDMTPTHSLFANLVRAFFVGGVICLIGQGFTNLYKSWGAGVDLAAAYTTLTLVFLSVLFTGLNIYPKLAKFGGAGTLVPITGFANSVAAPAVEFKKEGQVFGIGCKIFTIAGPVILYGIFTSWVLGVIYYIFIQLGVV
jgi:stage V sporulation protein AC